MSRRKDPTELAAQEAVKALDALASVSVELSCHCDAHPSTLVLSAGKLRETCATIDDAVRALKEILEIAAESGHGPVPPSSLNRPGAS